MTQRGFSMIEVMVTLVILSIGLLGLAGLQARGLAAQREAYQRAQALALLKDMAGRIHSDRTAAKAGSYVATGSSTRGTGYNGSAQANCSALASSALDLCEWHNGLLGAATGSGTLTGARGCIYDITAGVANTERVYRIAVAWQGFAPTAIPAVNCGVGAYGSNDAMRRVVTMNIAVPVLN